MLLTITTTHQPATNLGFLLHKHPDRLQAVDLTIGRAHIFYPESTLEKATIALLLDIDSIDMVKKSKKRLQEAFALGQYVNDRPYVASSFMSVALSKAFSTAMNGKCTGKPELARTKMPFEVKISVLSAPRGGELLIRKLFEPLGYKVIVEPHILDEKFKEWGMSKYFTLTISHTVTMQELLCHLYVLIPVLDNDKHYFVSESEIDKLLTKGKGWLEKHPKKQEIIRRYLLNLHSLTKETLKRLEVMDTKGEQQITPATEKRNETLHQQRLSLVLAQIKQSNAKTVIDLGCGEGKLLKMLLEEKQFSKIAGMDVSYDQLCKAKERLFWEEMSPKQKERITLFQGALTYKDRRLEGFDAAAIVEVIEHLDQDRLSAFERVIFEFAKPKTVVLTTPNATYNVLFENLKEGSMRHPDHRFEWTKKEFETWAKKVAQKNNYTVTFHAIGQDDNKVGAPSQMAIFTHEN